jgi:hypothetical protein
MSTLRITQISGIPYVNAAVADGGPTPVPAGITARASANSATKDAQRPRHLRLVK